MIVHSRIAITVILTLIQTIGAVTNNTVKDPDVNLYDTKTKLTFAKLLKSIVKVNEDRFNAMKRLTQLQDINVARGVLRSSDNRFLKLGPVLGNESSKVLAVVILQPSESSEESSEELAESDYDSAPEPNRLVKDYFNIDDDYLNYSEEHIFHVGREQDVLNNIKGCRKESLKLCACVAACRSVCRDYYSKQNVQKRCDTACRSICRKKVSN